MNHTAERCDVVLHHAAPMRWYTGHCKPSVPSKAWVQGAFVSASVILGAMALVAVWLPAARASRVTPIRALHTEYRAMAEICPPKRIESGRGGGIIPVLLCSNPRRGDETLRSPLSR